MTENNKDNKNNRFIGEFTIIKNEEIAPQGIVKPFYHGGPGSGHFGHEGRPGERGGSAPSGDGGHFDSVKWTKMPMDQRRDTWNKLSTGQRDRLADPVHSIPAREVELLKPVGSWPVTKDIESNVGIRIGNAGDQLTEESKVAIHATMRGYMDALREAGVPDEKIAPLARAATDALLSQSMEAYTRQLGDHGIRHIEHDINTSMEILNSIPGEATPDRVAMLYTAAIWHDEGYLTEPSRVFLDEGHPRWSRDNFEENVGPMVANALGTSSVREISSTIRYHDATSMDWKEDALGSAMRVADNTALFQKDKMPPVFKYVPENTNTLIKLADGELDLDHAKTTMHANIRKSDLSPVIRGRLDQAVEEITQYTPKATLGMLGGEMQGVEWREDHPVVKLALSDQLTRLHKVADLGQNQFAKFAKAYDVDPKQFEHDLSFTFKNRAGTTLLEGEIAPGPLRSLAHLGWKKPVEKYIPPGTRPRPDGFEPTTRSWRA